jgi:hypothetical protein
MSILRRVGERLSALVGPALEDLLHLAPHTYKNSELASTNARLLQLLLATRYDAIRAQSMPPLPLADTEFRAYSQNGEDGILLYIFSLIDALSRRSVEICAGSGVECNTANLIIHHGWAGLLVDGDKDNVRRGRVFYAGCKDTLVCPPTLVHAWVTAENVNEIIREHGFVGEIDLLSIDVDGMDYWIWKAIEVVQPRVVIVEFNAFLGPERAITIPYRSDFKATNHTDGSYGASLGALVKLGREKGYRLIGSQSSGVNAFFVRNGIGEKLLPEVLPETCFKRARTRVADERQFHGIARTEWIAV